MLAVYNFELNNFLVHSAIHAGTEIVRSEQSGVDKDGRTTNDSNNSKIKTNY